MNTTAGVNKMDQIGCMKLCYIKIDRSNLVLKDCARFSLSVFMSVGGRHDLSSTGKYRT